MRWWIIRRAHFVRLRERLAERTEGLLASGLTRCREIHPVKDDYGCTRRCIGLAGHAYACAFHHMASVETLRWYPPDTPTEYKLREAEATRKREEINR